MREAYDGQDKERKPVQRTRAIYTTNVSSISVEENLPSLLIRKMIKLPLDISLLPSIH